MSNNFCKTCGSRDLIADRALAGKLICRNCWTPLAGKVSRGQIPMRNRFINYLVFFIVGVILLTLISRIF